MRKHQLDPETLDDATGRVVHSWPGWVEQTLRWFAGVLVVYTAFLLAVVESFLVPFKAFGVYIPVAAVAAAVGNYYLPKLMRWWCDVRLWSLLPGAVWFVVIIAATTRTSEGDLIIANLWPGPVMLVSGAAAVAVSTYQVVLGTARR